MKTTVWRHAMPSEARMPQEQVLAELLELVYGDVDNCDPHGAEGSEKELLRRIRKLLAHAGLDPKVAEREDAPW